VTQSPPPVPRYLPPGTRPHEVSVDDTRTVLVIAGTRRRVVARLLDFGLAALVVLLCSAPPYLPLFLDLDLYSDGRLWLMVVLSVTTILSVLVSLFVLRVLTIARWGRTIGQRIVGIRVVRQADGVGPPGLRAAYKRWVVPRHAGSFGGLEDIWMQPSDHELGRCRHDRLAGTVVVLAVAPSDQMR
jgi:hypothetical protein